MAIHSDLRPKKRHFISSLANHGRKTLRHTIRTTILGK